MSAGGRGGGLRSLGASLETWTPARGRAIDPLHAIAAAWPGIVGADVAAQSAPLELSGASLVVGTRSSAWSQQLQFLSLHVLARIRTLPCGVTVERLTFRTGLLPRARRRDPGARSAARVRPGVAATDAGFEPAADLAEAFARLRARMQGAARSGQARCERCDAAVEAPGALGQPRSCAPCAGEAQTQRRTIVERLVYMAPWFALAELREHVPDLRAAEYDAIRKTLLARWWLVLERARQAGRVSSSGVERHVGSSYVLLHSRLSPDRITPAIVRNLLGLELEQLLWPDGAADRNATT
ncbi:MAG: hypothetical protein NVS1B2_04580 [Vulcanimicrobiaceae bacterium]